MILGVVVALFVLCFVNKSGGTSVDLSRISYGHVGGMDVDWLIFRYEGSEYVMKINCTNCVNVTDNKVYCQSKQLVKVTVTLSKMDTYFNIPFNVSCKADKNAVRVDNLVGTATVHAVQLSWTVNDASIDKYVIYRTEDTKYDHKIITTEGGYYLVKNLREKTQYGLCVATIDSAFNTGLYRCVEVRTDFSETGPVRDVVIRPYSDFVEISWTKPEYDGDRPLGYVVKYTDEDGRCGEIVIRMSQTPIVSKSPCPNRKTDLHWTDLQLLTVDKLRPYTSYTVLVSPVNGNRTQISTTKTFRTKEGESGPVHSLQSSIRPGWLYIEYKAPSHPNGVVTKYRMTIVLQRRGLCEHPNVTVHGPTDITSLYHFVSMSSWTKCSRYSIEVSPINGWSQNDGVGRRASIVYDNVPGVAAPISSISARFTSTNVVRVSWNKTGGVDDCPKMGFVVEVTNMKNESDCAVRVVHDEECAAVRDISTKGPKCTTVDVKKRVKDGVTWTVLIGRRYSPSRWYHVTIWRITDVIAEERSLPLISVEGGGASVNDARVTDCFTDCYNEVYDGIRSESDCVQWRTSPKYHRYWNTTSRFCTMKGDTRPWCATSDSYKYCSVPKCTDVDQISGCVGSVQQTVTTTTTSVTLTWTPPEYRTPIGYVTLLYDTLQSCEQCHIQTCPDCATEAHLGAAVKTFYWFCGSKTETRVVVRESTFRGLRQDKEYLVYVVPLISAYDVGEVRNTSVRTALAKPHVPTNIKNGDNSMTSVSFGWDKQTDYSTWGRTDYYETVLTRSNVKMDDKKVYNEAVEFTKLDVCTEYCVDVSATNKAGSTQSPKAQCQQTKAPKLGNVNVDDVESGTSLERVLSWRYSEKDSCHRSYRVRYRMKYVENEMEYRETSDTSISMTNLRRNMIYVVSVRVETNVDTEDGVRQGEFSVEKEFYTGTERPEIHGYKEYVSVSRELLNISWSFNTSFDGSVFEFIVVVRNTSGLCLGSAQFVCQDCPAPYLSTNLNETSKTKRQKLLDNKGLTTIGYKKDNNNLNASFIMKTPLGNYSVEIIAVNLMGVHTVHEERSIAARQTSSASMTAVIPLILLLIPVIAIILMLKYKHRPRCIYNVITKSDTVNGGVVKKQTKTRPIKDQELDHKVRSPIKTNSRERDSRVSQHSAGVTVKENLPLLEPKRKTKGINLKEFTSYYQRMSSDDNELLIQEYKKLTADCKKLEKDLGLTVNTGKAPSNTKKNRFVNILPFDQTRVIIEGRTCPNDYINANYIPFTTDVSKHEYIASQGPIEGTIDDFWLMIWKQNINCIIMLTRTMEDNKFKCLQYWPDNVGEEVTYGSREGISVILEEEMELESHVERVLLVRYMDGHDSRRITQLHMHTWFDYSAPNLEYFDKLLFRFHELASTTAANPYLIHCSAGVGRTGTLICIDRIIKELVSGCQEINIFDNVLTLRHYRNFMVQRQAQYVFIHDYIDHFLKKYMKMEDAEETIYFNED